MKNKLLVIKIGGNIIDEQDSLDTFVEDFAKIKHRKILIHGGGKIATKLNERLGIKTVMNEGRRITSEENLDTVTMVYAGLVNKRIVGKLQGNDCNALGLSGSDANCILSKKRPVTPIDFGWVGDVESINIASIDMFLNGGMIPVFCAISHDGKGQLLNVNADTVASEIAIAMSEKYDVELTYCFEKKGVLQDVNDDNSVIEDIDSQKYDELKESKTISDGMLPKMENCFHALNHGVSTVIIGGQKVMNNDEIHTKITL